MHDAAVDKISTDMARSFRGTVGYQNS